MYDWVLNMSLQMKKNFLDWFVFPLKQFLLWWIVPDSLKKAKNMVETYFSSIRVFFHRHWVFTGQQKKGGNHLYTSLPIPPVQGHPDIYLQFAMWDDYHVFTSLVIISLLLDEVYHLGELPFNPFMAGTVII